MHDCLRASVSLDSLSTRIPIHHEDSMKRRCLFTVVLLCVCLLFSGVVFAQSDLGGISGFVKDPSGAIVPNAKVTVRNNSGIERKTTTNESGYYTFPSLKDGTYKVVAELPGFKKTIRDGVIVDVNTTVRVDVKMEVGAIQESVTVQGESPVLQTDRTDTGRIIESKMVTALPLTFNRNFQSLLIVVPGATRPHRGL